MADEIDDVQARRTASVKRREQQRADASAATAEYRERQQAPFDRMQELRRLRLARDSGKGPAASGVAAKVP